MKNIEQTAKVQFGQNLVQIYGLMKNIEQTAKVQFGQKY